MAVAVLAVVPALFLRLTDRSVGVLGDAALFGLAILAASCWIDTALTAESTGSAFVDSFSFAMTTVTLASRVTTSSPVCIFIT